MDKTDTGDTSVKFRQIIVCSLVFAQATQNV